jgi:hypothetical protein
MDALLPLGRQLVTLLKAARVIRDCQPLEAFVINMQRSSFGG